MKIILCPQTFYFHWGHNIDLYNNKMYDLRTDNVNMVTFEKRLYVTPRYRICQCVLVILLIRIPWSSFFWNPNDVPSLREDFLIRRSLAPQTQYQVRHFHAL